MLTQLDIINKLKKNSLKYKELGVGEYDYNDDGTIIDFGNMPYIRFYRGYFIFNKHTSKEFFDIVFEGEEDLYLQKIIKILNIYCQFNYALFNAKNDGFFMTIDSFDINYTKRDPKQEKIPRNPLAFMTNLCSEIALGPMTECTLGMQNTAYDYQELYEKIVYPNFKEMLKNTIGLEITDISQFDDKSFEVLKMAKI